MNVIRTSIACESDKQPKFSNPKECKGKGNDQECLKNIFKNYAKPKDWKRNLWELDTLNPDNNGLQNEDLIIWMRTAAFPNFRKLYRKINHNDPENIAISKHFKEVIQKGNYFLIIEYNYEVASFSGEKYVVLSILTMVRGKNTFLGIAFIVAGCGCFLIGVMLLSLHVIYGKTTEESIAITSMTPFYDNISTRKTKQEYAFQSKSRKGLVHLEIEYFFGS